jgi:hypothetical protein
MERKYDESAVPTSKKCNAYPGLEFHPEKCREGVFAPDLDSDSDDCESISQENSGWPAPTSAVQPWKSCVKIVQPSRDGREQVVKVDKT